MSKKSVLVFFVILAVLISGCQSATAEPMAAPTDTAIPAPTDLPEPTRTSQPTATPVQTVFTDDFSSDSGMWGKCEHCELKDGSLIFGPYKPVGSGTDQLFYLVCEACGLHPYYRVSADVTYSDGYGADRTFGIMAGLTEGKNFIGAGTVSTSTHALYETFDFGAKAWGGTNFAKFSAVHPGSQTNRIEVEIKPALRNHGDITVRVNGTEVIVLEDQYVEPTWVGLYLGWHSVAIAYDNFEYENLSSK